MEVQNISLGSRLLGDVLAVFLAVSQGDCVRDDPLEDHEDVGALPCASVVEQSCKDLSAWLMAQDFPAVGPQCRTSGIPMSSCLKKRHRTFFFFSFVLGS